MSAKRILDVLKTKRYAPRLVMACVLLMALAAAPLHAQKFQNLYNFDCNKGGCFPYDFGRLSQGQDGNLYGATVNGTASGNSLGLGKVFSLTQDGSTDTDL